MLRLSTGASHSLVAGGEATGVSPRYRATETENHLPVLGIGFYNLGMPVWSLMREILRDCD
jgi:hypothetical protein